MDEPKGERGHFPDSLPKARPANCDMTEDTQWSECDRMHGVELNCALAPISCVEVLTFNTPLGDLTWSRGSLQRQSR